MKYAFAGAVLLFAASAAFAQTVTKTGQIRLRGRTVPVSITTGTSGSDYRLVVGRDSFQYRRTDRGTLLGSLEVTRYGVATESKNLRVVLNRESVQRIGSLSRMELSNIVDNADEVICDARSNAFIMVADNLLERTLGNCVTLR